MNVGWFALVTLLCVNVDHYVVCLHIKDKGPINYCNFNPKSIEIEKLSETDLGRVNKLEQLHIISRHGPRSAPEPISKFFVNSKEKWNCNWTSIETRKYQSSQLVSFISDYDSVSSSASKTYNHNDKRLIHHYNQNNSQNTDINADYLLYNSTIYASKYENLEWISMSKYYIDNEQSTEGNCMNSNSLYQAILQFINNARIIYKHYIDDTSTSKKHNVKYQLFNKYELLNITKAIITYNLRLLQNDFDLSLYNGSFYEKYIPIRILGCDLERTITPPILFFTELLRFRQVLTSMKEEEKEEKEKENKSENDVISINDIDLSDISMAFLTHDSENDPYTPNSIKSCSKLKDYIVSTGIKTDSFKKWRNSHKVQTTVEQWLKDPQTKNITSKTNIDDYDVSDWNKFYKAGQLLIMMYCAGLNVPISTQIFENMVNFTYEYRKHLLHNYETSIDTCTLASMPVFHILNEFIDKMVQQNSKNDDASNNNNDNNDDNDDNQGYCYKFPKLVYHSTRGISTLYYLEALGISDGLEPGFGEMTLLEIYSRSKDDYNNYETSQLDSSFDSDTSLESDFGNYLFRFVRRGKYLGPLPILNLCQQESRLYNNNSQLCNLKVLMQYYLSKGMNIDEWMPLCQNVTSSVKSKSKSKSKSDSSNGNDESGGEGDTNVNVLFSGTFIVTFVVGVVFGNILTQLFDCFCCRNK